MNSNVKYIIFFIVTYTFLVGWDYLNNNNPDWMANLFQAVILILVYGLFTWAFSKKTKTSEKL